MKKKLFLQQINYIKDLIKIYKIKIKIHWIKKRKKIRKLQYKPLKIKKINNLIMDK